MFDPAAARRLDIAATLLQVRPWHLEMYARTPVIAALSSNHLGALSFPASLRRLYIARDNDAAGRAAVQRLTERAIEAGVQPHVLIPATNDFNADLCRLGVAALRARLAGQLVPEDAAAFIPSVAAGSG